ncbi:LVIVD repeat-containing protein [Ilumatobacter sp.]|uniref:LVIVD repeat-containing protein n=1 Tax=Ilumatobacter sp. TaxID=1967498 RepID=UPI003C4B1EDD
MALAIAVPTVAGAQSDPREGLGAGFLDAESTISGLEHTGVFEKPDGIFSDGSTSNSNYDSDLAFQGELAFMGNYGGFQVFDVADPTNPAPVAEVVCPGGQGDLSVYGDLLFRSVEANNGRWDCGTQGNSFSERDQTMMRGIQVWNISDVTNPVQITAVPLCRGSHTHSIVEDPNDPTTVYVYNSGTSSTVGTNFVSCSNTPADSENPARWKTEIIAVPLAAPETAAVVNEARLFTDSTSGAINGLESQTDACHDITAYPAIGLAAGACEGNGILIDISDPANPVRLDAVADNENFAYWHSATFNNDGTTVVFTDEWGGGSGARCRATDPVEWGANAIFDIVDDGSGPRMEFRSYHKMPAVQTSQENCVAHNGSLVPVPGRDILVQAWYQGGVSLMDFTDSSNPVEIAYFDRGPISPTSLILGGFWSAYWYNGDIIGSEIARGLDVFGLAESPMMSAREIAAAESVTFDETNVQGQDHIAWAPSTAVVGSFVDQAARSGALAMLDQGKINQIEHFLTKADSANKPQKYASAAKEGRHVLKWLGDDAFADLSAAIVQLSESLDAQAAS